MRNDLSGSTRVLSEAIRSLGESPLDIHLYTATIDYQGFLSKNKGVTIHNIPYRRSSTRTKTAWSYIYAQCWLFFAMFRYFNEPVKVYISTVLPFGAALSSWVMGKSPLYHVHEISLAPAPAPLRRWLFRVMNLTAKKVIVVSHYLKSQLPLKRQQATVVHNCLSEDFIETAAKYSATPGTKFTALMISSLAEYKGVFDMIELAKHLPQVSFVLVLNAAQEEISLVIDLKSLPDNFKVHSAQKDVHPFYQRAHVLLNLSHPDRHIETFGMTVLEGMAYGLPCIIPPVGGVLELVEEGRSGFLIDSKDTQKLSEAILRLRDDEPLHRSMSENARADSKKFSVEAFTKSIVNAVMN